MLELINRARQNPTKEGIILDSLDTGYSRDARARKPSFFTNLRPEFASYPPAPPLAFRRELIQAARAHSQDMVARRYFDHVNPDGADPTQRAAARGYDSGVAENLDGGGASARGEVIESHFGLMVDCDNIALSHPIGHRLNVLDGTHTEVGVGIAGSRAGGKVTQDFGGAARAYILGVAYHDANGNGAYDPGEGMAGVTVRPSSGKWHAVTSASGGFAIPIDPVETVTDTINVPFAVQTTPWSSVQPYNRAYREQQMHSAQSITVNLTWSGGGLASPKVTSVQIKRPVLRNYRITGTDRWYYAQSMVTTQNVKADLKAADPGAPAAIPQSPDMVPPRIAVVYPDSSQTVFSSSIKAVVACADAIEIRAQAGVASAGNPATLLTRDTDPATGSLKPHWRGVLNLVPGWNTIRFTAKGRSGNASSVTRTVFLAPHEGSYTGLFGDAASADRGRLSLLVTRAKAFSGVLMVGGARYNVRGEFGAALSASVVIKRRTGGDIVLALSLTADSGANPIAGTVKIGDGEAIALSGARRVYDGRTVSAPYAGRINMTLSRQALAGQADVDSAAPEGEGFAFMTVSRSGRVVITTRLADGTPLTLGGWVDGEDSLPISKPLYAGAKGHLHGWLAFASGNDPDSGEPLPACSGNLEWKRPQRPAAALFKGGFSLGLHADGAVYVPAILRKPAAPASRVAAMEGTTPFGTTRDCAASVQFSEGGLAAPRAVGILVRRPAIVSIPVPGAEKMAMAFVNADGRFSGAFFDTEAKRTRKYAGIVKGKSGAGFFLTETGSGKVEILDVTE